MAAGRLNAQDKKDLEKFTKFFIFKSLQIIVQSRLGEKIRTKSKPFSSGADWFNLAIRDIPEVHAEAKKVLAGQQHVLSQNVCVEISLRTSEGDTMMLETWYIGLNQDQPDPNVRVSFAVYNRMGVALKSLFSVSRVPPAYRLARQQGLNGGDYVICYRIYLGDPQFFQLGDGYQITKVGAVPTPTGTIVVNLAYRTKLLISSHKASKEVMFNLKDDHFKRDASPKRPTTPKPCILGFRRNSSTDEFGAAGYDRQDLCSTTFSTSPPEGVHFENNNVTSAQPMAINGKSAENIEDQKSQSNPERGESFGNLQKVGAFATHKSMKDLKGDVEDVPFQSLLNTNKATNIAECAAAAAAAAAVSKASLTPTASSNKMQTSNTDEVNKSNGSEAALDDFVMVELKTPFAGVDANTDLGQFYRDCQGAPQLSMFEQEPEFNDALEEVTSQLARFESDMKEFDDFVHSLRDTDSSD